ncbi:MAG: hypothetical protein AAFY20_19565 [Cyanobacteria bacterium J06639_14]
MNSEFGIPNSETERSPSAQKSPIPLTGEALGPKPPYSTPQCHSPNASHQRYPLIPTESPSQNLPIPSYGRGIGAKTSLLNPSMSFTQCLAPKNTPTTPTLPQ